MNVMRASLAFPNDFVTYRLEDGVTKTPRITEDTHKDASLTDEFSTDDDTIRDGKQLDDVGEDTEDSPREEIVFTLIEDEDSTVKATAEKAIG